MEKEEYRDRLIDQIDSLRTEVTNLRRSLRLICDLISRKDYDEPVGRTTVLAAMDAMAVMRDHKDWADVRN